MIKKVNEISSQFKKIARSGSVKEMFNNIPMSFTEFLIFACMLIFMVIPLYQLVYNLWKYNSYSITVSIAHMISLFLVLFSISIRSTKNCIEKRKQKIISMPVVFFGFTVLMMILSTIVNGFTDQALHGDIYRNESLLTFIMYFAVYFFGASLISRPGMKSVLLYTYVIVSVFIAVCTLIHLFVKPIESFERVTGVTAVFYQFNHYGYFMLMSILISSGLFIMEKNIALRIICVISFVLNNIVLIINDTFGCYLACFIGLIFEIAVISLCEKKFNKFSVIMLALFIIISLIMSIWYRTIFYNIITFVRDTYLVSESLNLTEKEAVNNEEIINETVYAGSGRWVLWTYTVKYIKDKPLLGYGVEGISHMLYSDTYSINNRPHCEFLQYAAFFGIPAAISYICGIFSVYINGLKKRCELDIYMITALIAAFGYLVSSAFGNTMFYTAPYFFILLGMGFSTYNHDKNGN